MAQKIEKQHAKATRQTTDTPLKIPYLSLLSQPLNYTYQPQSPTCPHPPLKQTSVSGKIELARKVKVLQRTSCQLQLYKTLS